MDLLAFEIDKGIHAAQPAKGTADPVNPSPKKRKGASAGPSLGADVVQPAAQRTSGRRCLQPLQATAGAVAMSTRAVKTLLPTACICTGGPTRLASLLPRLDLVPFGLS